MLRIRVTTAEAVIQETETITAGRRGLDCSFTFDSAWDGLAKTVVVSGVVQRDVMLVGDSIVVPGECLAKENYPLKIGVYGANSAGYIVIPTVWASFGKIVPSAKPSGVDPDEVTPDLVSQIEQNSANALYLAQKVKQMADSGAFDGADGAPGLNGTDGVSPTLAVSDITGGHRITITDASGTRTVDVMDGATGPAGADGAPGQDGAPGAPGADGYSPTVSVTDITDGHRVTITDKAGTHTFDVMDGTIYRPGADEVEWTGGNLGRQTTPDYVEDAVEAVYNTAAAKYAKPAGGIPKSDLASAVQTSLGKADTALQEGDLDPVWDGILDKLDEYQGVAHAGEFLVVGSDGSITTVAMSAWQGGSY